jgi:hypothetical protein
VNEARVGKEEKAGGATDGRQHHARKERRNDVYDGLENTKTDGVAVSENKNNDGQVSTNDSFDQGNGEVVYVRGHNLVSHLSKETLIFASDSLYGPGAGRTRTKANVNVNAISSHSRVYDAGDSQTKVNASVI